MIKPSDLEPDVHPEPWECAYPDCLEPATEDGPDARAADPPTRCAKHENAIRCAKCRELQEPDEYVEHLTAAHEMDEDDAEAEMLKGK